MWVQQQPAPPPVARNGIVQQWAGRIPRPLFRFMPPKGYVTNARDLAALWQNWGLKAEVPVVDFEKYIVIVSTSRSSLFQVAAIQIDANGDMKTVVMASPDMRGDVAFVITVAERKGAKTFQGTPIG